MTSSPLELFAVYQLIGVYSSLLSFDYSITNHSLYLTIGTILLLGTLLSITSYKLLVPSNLGVVSEMLYSSVLTMARTVASNQGLFPLLLALFGTLMFTNLVSNIPYSYAVASSMVFSIGASATIWVACTYMAISRQGIAWLATFIPSGTPLVLLPVLALIELVSYMARALSLGIRLFANMLAGHTLLAIVSSMTTLVAVSSWIGLLTLPLPVALLTALVGLELAVAVIQAYVFTVLASIYSNESLSLVH